MKRLVATLWCLSLVVPSAAGAAADEFLGVELPERLSLEGDFRLRYEHVDNQFRAGVDGDDTILALRTRIRAKLRLTDWLSARAELQDSRVYLDDSETPLSTREVNAAELLRAFLELQFADRFGGTHRVQAGRITMDIGSRRLVARNRYRNTTNAFTGVDWIWYGQDTFGQGKMEVRAFYTLPIERLPDSPGRLRDNVIQFDDESKNEQFWGFFYSDEVPWGGDMGELYVFGLKNSRTQASRNRLTTPGFRFYRDPRRGRFDFEIETALQTGTSRSPLTGTTSLDHNARLHHVTLGYSFDAPWFPRLLLRYDYASGDRDPNDDDNERFNSLFSARRFEYAPTSLWGPISRANISAPGARLELRPADRWTAMLHYRALWLASKKDEWSGTGVRDPAGDSGSFVGHHVELRTRWRPQSFLLLEAGYAHIFDGEFIRNAPNSNGGDSNYFYGQLVVFF